MRKNANSDNPGCYLNENGTYDVQFQNPIFCVNKSIASNKSLKEATEIYLKNQIDFYSQHTYLLPKWIYIQRGKFIIRIKYKVNFDNNFKDLYLGCFNSLQSAEKAKLDFITNLI